MKKLTLFLLLLALTLPSCAAPAASQPGITGPQTVGTQEQSQSTPQTTQSQEQAIWEQIEGLAPKEYGRTPLPICHTLTFTRHSIGTDFAEFIDAQGAPHQLAITDRGLELTYSPICECKDVHVTFAQNQEGKLVLISSENVPIVRNDLTPEDFEDFQVNETNFCLDFLPKVGDYTYWMGNYHGYKLTNGGVAIVYDGMINDKMILTRLDIHLPQSSTNEK